MFLLGVPFDNCSKKEILQKIEGFIKEKKPHNHIVINADKINKYYSDRKIKEIIDNTDLITVDGQPLVWISRLFQVPVKERITGVDLMQDLLKLSREKGYSVFLFGAKEEIVRELKDIILEKYRGIRVVGYRNGYFNEKDEKEIVDEIKNSGADILFIGISSPKKEYFVENHLKEMNVPFVMGVGGSFDVMVGNKKRSPIWIQRIGMEWLYRFIQEPRRLWKRYLIGNFIFLNRVLWNFIKLYVFTFFKIPFIK